MYIGPLQQMVAGLCQKSRTRLTCACIRGSISGIPSMSVSVQRCCNDNRSAGKRALLYPTPHDNEQFYTCVCEPLMGCMHLYVALLWAARCITRLLVESVPKGLVFFPPSSMSAGRRALLHPNITQYKTGLFAAHAPLMGCIHLCVALLWAARDVTRLLITSTLKVVILYSFFYVALRCRRG